MFSPFTRRTFLQRSTTGLGALALTSLLKPELFAAGDGLDVPGALKRLHFAPKAKRVIYLFMSGAPSHLDLFDPKPKLDRDDRQGPARQRPQGPAHHRR